MLPSSFTERFEDTPVQYYNQVVAAGHCVGLQKISWLLLLSLCCISFCTFAALLVWYHGFFIGPFQFVSCTSPSSLPAQI